MAASAAVSTNFKIGGVKQKKQHASVEFLRSKYVITSCSSNWIRQRPDQLIPMVPH